MPAPGVILAGARRRPLLALGGTLAIGLLLIGLFGSRLAPYDPLRQLPDGLTAAGLPQPPSRAHLLGTDRSGRDVLSRLLIGARLSLIVGLGGMGIALALGLAVGVSAGFLGGWADGLLMRFTDVILAFPAILLAIALAAVQPHRGVLTLIAIIGFINWAPAARLFRSETLSLRERLYVEAARAAGASSGRVLLRHILPHLAGTAWVVASLAVATTVLLDAGLNFLGIGLPRPAPSWGLMLLEARDYYRVAPWLPVWPGLAVVLTVAAFNLIAHDLQSHQSAPGDHP